MPQPSVRETVKTLLDKVGLLQPVAALRANQRDQELRRNLKKFYAGFIASGDLCFDVGANYGNRTEIFLDLGAKVVAIEPQPECVSYLQEHFAQNKQFTLVNGGLGEARGEHELYLCTNHGTTTMSQEWISHVKDRSKLADHSWDQTITVQVYRMDELIARYGKPAFCKIDVEGFELSVLKGLSQPIQALSFECTPEFKEPSYACVDHLLTLGDYQFNYSWGESAYLVADHWLSKADIYDLIGKLDPQQKSGDIYARLRPS